MAAWMCAVCGTDLPALARADCRYCGVRCRVRAYRLRDRKAEERREKRRRQRADRRLIAELAAAERRVVLAKQDSAFLRAKLTIAEGKIQTTPPTLAPPARKPQSPPPAAAPPARKIRAQPPSRAQAAPRSAPQPDQELIVAELKRKLISANWKIARLEQQSAPAVSAAPAVLATLRDQNKTLREENTGLRWQNDHFRDLINDQAGDYHEHQRESRKLKDQLEDSERDRDQLRRQATERTRQAERVPQLSAEVERLKCELVEAGKREDTLRTERDRARAVSAASLTGWGVDARKRFEERQAAVAAAADRTAEARLQSAQNAGWQPRLDSLVCEVEVEFQAADRLATWQADHRLPVTARRLESKEDAYLLAMRAALAMREAYRQHPPARRRLAVRWNRPAYELDPESERELAEQTRQRIAKLREPIQEWVLRSG